LNANVDLKLIKEIQIKTKKRRFNLCWAVLLLFGPPSLHLRAAQLCSRARWLTAHLPSLVTGVWAHEVSLLAHLRLLSFTHRPVGPEDSFFFPRARLGPALTSGRTITHPRQAHSGERKRRSSSTRSPRACPPLSSRRTVAAEPARASFL
jgi:hypothetical protein